MDDKLVDLVVQQVMQKVAASSGNGKSTPPASSFTGIKSPGMTEFVGTAFGDTIGLVIANLDPTLHQIMGLDPKYRSIGIFGGRTGAGPHLSLIHI